MSTVLGTNFGVASVPFSFVALSISLSICQSTCKQEGLSRGKEDAPKRLSLVFR